MPKMKHPESRRHIDVQPDAVDTYRTQGWQVVGDKPVKAPAKKAAAKKSPARTSTSPVPAGPHTSLIGENGPELRP